MDNEGGYCYLVKIIITKCDIQTVRPDICNGNPLPEGLLQPSSRQLLHTSTYDTSLGSKGYRLDGSVIIL